jgi:hypothetical protein
LTSTNPNFAVPSGQPPAPGAFTGETLATICPVTCNPFYPNLNRCDITAGCSNTGGNLFRHYCTCRPGFRASEWNEKDFSKQFRIPGQANVYVGPGVVCNQACNDPSCSEVLSRPVCA